jgi:microfibrillar-associated protein 1
VEAKDALSGLYQETDRKWWQCAVQGTGGLGPLQGAGKLSRIPEERNSLGLWVCGSYAYPGIPLLEGCVGSAKNVVNAIFMVEQQELERMRQEESTLAAKVPEA